MSGYTVSFHVKKFKASARSAQFMISTEHNCRKAYDLERDDKPNRSNSNIDYALTDKNVEYHCDEYGKWVRSSGAMDAYGSIRRAIDGAQSRANSVGMDAMILQLDPDYFDAYERGSQEWLDAAYRVGDTMINWARETFGEENVRAAQIHVDETSPHVHLQMVPAKDGKLNDRYYFGQTAWDNGIKSGRAKMVWYHNDLRQYMRDHLQLEITDERVTAKEKGKKRMTEAEMREWNRVEEEHEQKAEDLSRLERMQVDLGKWEHSVREREHSVRDREHALEREKTALETREREIRDREASLASQAAQAALNERTANDRAMEALKLLAKANDDYDAMMSAVDEFRDARTAISRVAQAKRAAARSSRDDAETLANQLANYMP